MQLCKKSHCGSWLHMCNHYLIGQHNQGIIPDLWLVNYSLCSSRRFCSWEDLPRSQHRRSRTVPSKKFHRSSSIHPNNVSAAQLFDSVNHCTSDDHKHNNMFQIAPALPSPTGKHPSCNIHWQRSLGAEFVYPVLLYVDNNTGYKVSLMFTRTGCVLRVVHL